MESRGLSKVIGPLVGLTKPYFSIFFTCLMAIIMAGFLARLDLLSIAGLASFFSVLTAALNSFNNVTDVAIDSVTKPTRPLPMGTIGKREAVRLSLLLYLVSVFLLLVLSSSRVILLILALDVILSYLFSASPVRLKRFPLLKGTILVSHSLIFPFLGAMLLRDFPTWQEWGIIPPLFTLGLATHTIQDFEDILGDRAVGERSLPILLGERRAAVAAFSLYLASIAVATPLPSFPYAALPMTLQAILCLLLARDASLGGRVFKVNAILSLLIALLFVLIT